jgi:hypothetical protein
MAWPINKEMRCLKNEAKVLNVSSGIQLQTAGLLTLQLTLISYCILLHGILHICVLANLCKNAYSKNCLNLPVHPPADLRGNSEESDSVKHH